MGNAGITQAERRADTLIQQVSGENEIQVILFQRSFFQKRIEGSLLHDFLCLLPGLLPEIGVLGGYVESMRQGALFLFLSRDTGPGRDHRLGGQKKAAAPPFVFCHGFTFF